MKVFSAPDIRNVAVLGHNTVGKTTLVSAMLHRAGATTRAGDIASGTCVTDFDPEEIERKISINLAAAHCVHRDTKVNFLDAPGYGIFQSEARCAVAAADAVLIVLDAVAGVEVQTEKAWKLAELYRRPVLFLVNRMDRERASFERCLEELQKRYGRGVVPLQIPMGIEKSFRGTVDLVRMEAHWWESGQRKDGPIPAEYADRAESEHKSLVEMVAEGEDHLMEKFFENGTLDAADLLPGLQEEIAERKVFPVLCASAQLEVGVVRVLDACVALVPPPVGSSVAAKDKDGKDTLVKCDEGAAPVAQVFKTISDPFSGRISIIRVLSGTFQSDQTYWNATRGVAERFGGLFLPQGKEHVAVTELKAGDIGAVAKLKETLSGDTLATRDNPLALAPIPFPEPAIAFAIEAKSKTDEDKLSTALHRLIEEDPSLHFERDEETKEFHLAGAGQLHVEIAVSRLKKRSSVEVILHPPKVPYRETITHKAEGHGRHKKQSGGHGQFADCKIEVSPLPRGADFEFENDIFGGAIPRNFIPAVEKGVQDVRKRGFLAGFPMVDFKVRLHDGQYHEVDSSEIAFKIAGALAYKDAMAKAGVTLLEPVMHVEIATPGEYMGDLMGDLSSRRGQVQGMDTDGDRSTIRALVPMSEMLAYGSTLRSITQGRADFHMDFSHYAEVPLQIREKLVTEAAKHRKEAAEE